MRKLAIFDLDGTLVDSMTDVAICFNEALSQCGFSEHPIEDYAKFVGGNLEQVVARLLPTCSLRDENIQRVKTLYREIYLHSPKPNTKPYPGIYSLLDGLAQRGRMFAVNTNKSQALTDEIIKTLFINYDFIDVVGYREDIPSKPDPYGVNMILSKVQTLPAEAMYIGDGASDIETAWAAGVPMVLVTWGQGTAADKGDERINKIVHFPQEVLKYMLEDNP